MHGPTTGTRKPQNAGRVVDHFHLGRSLADPGFEPLSQEPRERNVAVRERAPGCTNERVHRLSRVRKVEDDLGTAIMAEVHDAGSFRDGEARPRMRSRVRRLRPPHRSCRGQAAQRWADGRPAGTALINVSRPASLMRRTSPGRIPANRTSTSRATRFTRVSPPGAKRHPCGLVPVGVDVGHVETVRVAGNAHPAIQVGGTAVNEQGLLRGSLRSRCAVKGEATSTTSTLAPVTGGPLSTTARRVGFVFVVVEDQLRRPRWICHEGDQCVRRPVGTDEGLAVRLAKYAPKQVRGDRPPSVPIQPAVGDPGLVLAGDHKIKAPKGLELGLEGHAEVDDLPRRQRVGIHVVVRDGSVSRSTPPNQGREAT